MKDAKTTIRERKQETCKQEGRKKAKILKERESNRKEPSMFTTNKSAAFIRGCIQKFPDWPPVARTANGTALCYYVQLYRYFVSKSS